MLLFIYSWGFPDGSDGKESACSVGDLRSIPALGRSPGEGNGNPLQCSCLENPMDGGAWRTIVHGVTKRQTRLSGSLTSIHSYYEIRVIFPMSPNAPLCLS